MANLDKFYTKSEVAAQCVQFIEKHFPIEDILFIEPSAGDGKFLDYLPNYEAYDIAPENSKIKQQDFLELAATNATFTIGNPPFGKRSKLAIDFFNHAAELTDAIGFIVPVSFMKWSVQKELNKDYKLIDYFYLEPNSFTDNGKDFSVRCIFQLWVKKNGLYDKKQADKRMLKSPPIKHEDFLIWQYNATAQAYSTFDEDWEIATYRQGRYDFNKLFYPEDREDMKANSQRQYFFIKPLTEEARNIIMNMDFNALAERNTATPGFGKADFVSYYIELKEKRKNTPIS